jgi:hypothetical protein
MHGAQTAVHAARMQNFQFSWQQQGHDWFHLGSADGALFPVKDNSCKGPFPKPSIHSPCSNV